MRLLKLLGVIFLSAVLLITFCFTASAESSEAFTVKAGLLTKNASEWISQDAASFGNVSKATVTMTDDCCKFGNTAGLWPSMEHTLKNKVLFNIYSDRIYYDFTPNIRTSLRILLCDKDGMNRSVLINSVVSGASIDKDSGEIKASGQLKGILSLEGLLEGVNGQEDFGREISDYANEKGDINITGVCISIIGSSGKTIDVKDLSVLSPAKPQSTTGAAVSMGSSTNSRNNTTAGNITGGTTAAASSGNATLAPVPSKSAAYYSNSNGIQNENFEVDTEGNRETSSVTGVSISADISSDLQAGRIIPVAAAAQNVSSGYDSSGRVTVVIMLLIGSLILLAAYILFIQKKPRDH